MNRADHTRTQMKSPSINVEKLTLLQTISYQLDPPFTMENPYDEAVPNSLRALAISPDGQFLAINEKANGTKLWDMKAGKVDGDIGGIQDLVPPLLFSSDGQTLLGGKWDKNQRKSTIQTWNFRTGRLVRTSITFDLELVVISPDEKMVVGQMVVGQRGIDPFDPFGKKDELIALNLSTGEQLSSFELKNYSHRWHVGPLAVSSDGKVIVGTAAVQKESGDDVIFPTALCLWDGSTLRLLHMMSVMPAASAIAVSPDNQIIASGCYNGAIKLWHLSTAQHLHAFVGHEKDITALTFSADGRQLVSASLDGTIKFWEIK